MGIGTNGPHGKVSGRTGNLVWRLTKNGNILAIRPHKSHKPASEGQLKVRSQLSMMSSLLSLIPSAINPGFKGYSSKMSPMNAAVSYNLKHAVKDGASEFEINYQKFSFSRGPLFEPEEPGVIAEVDQKIVVSWLPENEDTAYNSETDLVTFLVYNPSTEEFCIKKNEVTRAEGMYTMQLPLTFEGDLIHCYMSFTSEKGMVSDSVYVGDVLVT